MTPLTALTDAQTAQIPAHVARYRALGARCGPSDRAACEAGLRGCYAAAGLPVATLRIVHVDSPYVWILASLLAEELLVVPPADRRTGRHALTAPELRDTLMALRPEASRPLAEAIVTAALQAVGRTIWLAPVPLAPLVRRAMTRTEWPYTGGQFWMAWHAYITFFLDVCHVAIDPALQAHYRAYAAWHQHSSRTWLHRDFALVAGHPQTLTCDAQGRLHHATRQALAWADGWGLWMWHGVRVTEQIVCAPESLTATQIAGEPNAQVQAVMIERVGIERLCQLFQAQTLDALTLTIGGIAHPYELLTCTVTDTTFTALKMRNPSVGIYHVEVVEGRPRTVDEALHLRKPAWMRAIPVAADGFAWHQQGDVYIVPDGAARLQRYPSTLT